MPTMASIVGNDPLTQFLRALTEGSEKRPIPLIATRIDVTIRGGLASVTTERTFRNTETQSIEATMTFPVPVDATLCALTARIDGRTLKAVAQARNQARETYEDAVDAGKSAVLHEELLKGIHMLSVAPRRSGRRDRGHRHLDGVAVVRGAIALPAHPDHGRPRSTAPRRFARRTIWSLAIACMRRASASSARTDGRACCGPGRRRMGASRSRSTARSTSCWRVGSRARSRASPPTGAVSRWRSRRRRRAARASTSTSCSIVPARWAARAGRRPRGFGLQADARQDRPGDGGAPSHQGGRPHPACGSSTTASISSAKPPARTSPPWSPD